METILIAALIVTSATSLLLTFLYSKEKNLRKDTISQQEYNTLLNSIALKEEEVRAYIKENSSLQQSLTNSNEKLLGIDQQLKQAVQLNTTYTQTEKELSTEIIRLRTINDSLSEKLTSQKQEITELQKQMKTEFENIANKLLEEKSERFSKQNKESVGTLLEPLEKSLAAFKEQVSKNLTEETKQRTSLEEQVRQMIEQSSKITKEANNLATALKGKSKIRGNWGELILETVLQNSGLQEGREYQLEKSHVDDETGRRLRPDALIYLPNNRTVIVDSKVSLTDYDLYCSTENEETQQEAIKNHIASMKRHIDTLATKRYDNLPNSTDFTIMFVPIEPAYMLAIEKDASMWNYAFSKRIMLISPSNLLPCLKLINDVWYKENQSLNAQKIVERGEKLYEKLVGFVDTMSKLGDSINKSQSFFINAQKQLSVGSGNVFSQAKMLKNLGLKSAKELPDWSDVELIEEK